MREPDYISKDGSIRLYHGDCLELIAKRPSRLRCAAVATTSQPGTLPLPN